MLTLETFRKKFQTYTYINFFSFTILIIFLLAKVQLILLKQSSCSYIKNKQNKELSDVFIQRIAQGHVEEMMVSLLACYLLAWSYDFV